MIDQEEPTTINPDIDDKLNDYAGGLQQMLDQERARADELRRQTTEADQLVKRLQQAIRVLKGEKAASGRKPGKAKRAAYSITNPPSETIMTAVREFVLSQPEGVTQREVVEATGRSHDPVRRALAVLRNEEVIRRAGKREGTSEHLFKAMPDHG